MKNKIEKRHPKGHVGSESPEPGVSAILESINEPMRYPLNVESY